MRRFLFIFAAALAFAQTDVRRTIVPGQTNTDTGILGFRELNGSGTHEVQVSAPLALSATYRMRWPSALGSSGDCIKDFGSGQLGFGACDRVAISDYFWSQTPGGALAAGVNEITLTPCPVGVNATDTRNNAYISGGTGAAEAVPYTVSGGAGTCTSGASSGTIKVTAANAHSGAWTIQNASFREAVVAADPGDMLLVAAFDAYGTTVIDKSLSLECGSSFGTGGACTITVHGDIVGIEADLFAPVQMRNFGLVSASSQSAGAGIKIGVTDGSNHNCGSRIEGLTIQNFYYGIWLKQGCKPYIGFNEIGDSTKYGIFSENQYAPDAGDGFIYKNTIANTSPLADAAIYITGAGGLKVEGNKILNAFRYGIDMLCCTGGTPTGYLQILGNNIDRTVNGGVRLGGTTSWYGTKIEGNLITDADTDAGTDGTFACLYIAGSGIDTTDFALNTCQSAEYGVRATAGTKIHIWNNKYGLPNGGPPVVSSVAIGIDEPLVVVFANIPVNAENGSVIYCSNCTEGGATGGTGAFGYRVAGAWAWRAGGRYIKQSGDTFGADMNIGTDDAFDVQIKRNGVLTFGVYAGQAVTYGYHTIVDGGVTGRILPGSGELKIGAFSNVPLTLYTDSAERWRILATGMLQPAADDTYDIGATGTRARTIYAKAGEFYKAGSTATSDYVTARKFNVLDAVGGNGAWDIQAGGSMVGNSYLKIRDNAGSRLLEATRATAGTPLNFTWHFGSFIPKKRLIADGDAVDDTVFGDLGATSNRWANIYGGAADFTGDIAASTATLAGSLVMGATTVLDSSRNLVGLNGVAEDLLPTTNDTYINGSTFFRWASVATVDFNVSGTITFPTGTTGYCWINSGGGVGGWALCPSASLPVVDSTGIAMGSADATKILRFEVDGFTTATTRVLTPQNADYTIAGTNLSQTFGNTQTFTNGIEFASTAGSKAMLFSSGATNKYEVAIATSEFRLIKAFVGSKIAFGYGYSGGFTEQAYIGDTQFNIKGLFLAGNSSIVVVQSHLDPATGSTYDLGNLLRWNNVKAVSADFTGAVTVGTDVRPDSNGGADVGTSSLAFSAGYFQNLIASATINPTSTAAAVTLGGSGAYYSNIHSATLTAYTAVLPDIDGGADLGSTTKYFEKVWTNRIDVRTQVIAPSGSAGASGTITVRDAAGTGTCTLIFSGGFYTGGTC